MSNIYLDKERHDQFQQKQDDIENGIQSASDNFSNELLQSKLANIQNKTIGSELMFSSLPASIGKASETYSRIKDVYQKLQVVKSKASDLLDSTTDKASDLLDSVKGKAGGLLDSVKGQAGDLVDSVKSQAGDFVGSVKGQAGDLVDSVKGQAINSAGTVREVQFDNPLFEGDFKPSIAETFGNVKNYIGGQIGELGSKVSVLPNVETSIGSLKQAIPKPQIIQDAVGDLSSNVKNTIGDVSDVAGDIAKSAISGASDLVAEGSSIIAEAAVPIIGDITALGSLAFGAYEGIKDLVDKPNAPPVPTINVSAGGVSQAGI